MGKRLFILSIDGVPFSLAQDAMQKGLMPNFQNLLTRGSWARINSVLPVISSVAWASFSTGVNPGKHGIFGFVDRDSKLQYVIQTSKYLREKSLWQRLHEAGKRVIAINVPGTYPPEPVNGIMIGDFLSPSIEKAAHPASIVPLLKELKYIIDPNPQLALTDKPALMSQIFETLHAREALTFHLLERESWDLFMLHIMETDRINHFFWDAKEDPTSGFHQDFWNFYQTLDEVIGRLYASLPDDVELMILSDHGFCRIEQDVDLNSFLAQSGFASFEPGAKSLKELSPSSVAYSLTPGRIYINRVGREENGSVPADQIERHCKEIRSALVGLKDPRTSRPIIDRVYFRDEIYHGSALDAAPELIAHPHNGYDLKAGSSGQVPIFQKGVRSGMHTYDDALLYVRGRSLKTKEASIMDVTPTIYELLGVSANFQFDGKQLLA